MWLIISKLAPAVCINMADVQKEHPNSEYNFGEDNSVYYDVLVSY